MDASRIVIDTLKVTTHVLSNLHEFFSIFNLWLLTDWPLWPQSGVTSQSAIPPLIKVITVALLEPVMTLLYHRWPAPPWILLLLISLFHLRLSHGLLTAMERMIYVERRNNSLGIKPDIKQDKSRAPETNPPAWLLLGLGCCICGVASLNATLVLFCHSLVTIESPAERFLATFAFLCFIGCRIPDYLLLTSRPQELATHRENWYSMLYYQIILIATRAALRLLTGQEGFPTYQKPSPAEAAKLFGPDQYLWVDAIKQWIPPWLTWVAICVALVLDGFGSYLIATAED